MVKTLQNHQNVLFLLAFSVLKNIFLAVFFLKMIRQAQELIRAIYVYSHLFIGLYLAKGIDLRYFHTAQIRDAFINKETTNNN